MITVDPEALAVIEIASVATGLSTIDALTKRARVDVRGSGTIEPGRFLIVFCGALAEVDEAWDAAIARAGSEIVDRARIPHVRPEVLRGLDGARSVAADADCVGIVEGQTVAGTIEACDRALKDAHVTLAGLRITIGLGGRAWFVVSGLQHDVEAATESASGTLGRRLARVEIIARPSVEVLAALRATGPFGGV